MLLAQVDAGQLEQHMVLLGKGPLLYYAAVVTLLWLATVAALMRAHQKRVDDSLSHKQEVKELLNAERERAVKQELVAAGFLKLVEMGALAVKPGKPKVVRQTADPLAADAPTVSVTIPRAGGTHGDD